MMGFSDWKTRGHIETHNPSSNGLKYLYDYSLEKANEMMVSPEYTKAIFIRDPKERLLSAYLDKAVSNNGFYLHNVVKHECACNPTNQYQCFENARQSLSNFFGMVNGGCMDNHWKPQLRRIDSKFWPYIQFVGHLEAAVADAHALLNKIGAWEEFGQTGWGPNDDFPVFVTPAGEAIVHATNAKQKLQQYYTPDLERSVEELYKEDYASPLLNLTQKNISRWLSP